MTNKELEAIFIVAEQNSENIFDVYDELSNYEDQYKEMNLAKIKPTIYDAYELYCGHKNKFMEMSDKVLTADYNAIIEQFDLKKLFDQIPEQYQGVVKQLIEEAGINVE